MQRQTYVKSLKIRFKYLISFLHFESIYIQFQWEINVFLHLLSCFSVFLNTSPSFSPSIFRRFIPEAVVQNQNYHINQNINVWAADLKPPGSLYPCVSLFLSLLQHLSLNASSFFQTIWSFYSILYWIWFGNCRFHKPTVGLFFFFFSLTASELFSKLMS